MKKTFKLLVAAVFSLAMILNPCEMPKIQASEIQYGDVDSDGEITSSDALAVLQHIINISELDENGQILADVNNDGNIDSNDALNILQYIIGTLDSFEAEVNKSETGNEEDEFYAQCSKIVKDNDAQYGMSVMSEDFYAKRIVTKSSAEIDFSDYNPVSKAERKDEETGEITYIVQFDTVEDCESCLNALNSNESVIYAEQDKYMSGDDETESDNDIEAEAVNSWGVKAMEADKYAAYLKETYNSSITVAVVDTGVAKHKFLGNRVLSGRDFVDNDFDANDQNTHGTHVAGTIVDCTPSLDVKILPVRVLDKNGSGTNSNVAHGIRYAVDCGADVINLSLGGYGCSKYIDDQIKYAVSKNVVVVVAAGNESNNTSSYCPAHIKNCIVVSAVDSSMTKASFSNYGDSVDVAAPGVNIKSCIPGGGYKAYDGTSMATPHISAAAAMIKYENPNASVNDVEKKLIASCKDLGDSGFDVFYGNGFPQLSKIIPGIALNQSAATVAVGKTVVLLASTTPSGQSVKWTSSDSSVATVSNVTLVNSGLVKGLKAGTAKITATVNNGGKTYSASCTVTVSDNSTEIIDSQEYYIVPKCATDLCLSIANDAKKNSSNVCLGLKTGASAVWVAHKSGNYWYFINKNSGKALDIYGDTIASKSNAQIWTLNSNNTQLFTLKEVSGGYFTLTPKANTKINLDVYGDSGWQPGTNVWTYTANNNSTQQFMFKKV